MKRCVLFLFLVCMPAFASRTLTDELGRKVVVPDDPRRIVCLVPSVVDDVYSLGAGDRVIAVSDYTKYPKEAAGKKKIGAPLDPSVEMIVALHPDLVLGSGGMNEVHTVDLLEHYGIPVFIVDPHGIQGIYSSIASIGRALHREREAGELVRRLQSRERAVREHTRGKQPVRVFMPLWYDPIVTIGSHAFITELIEAAGGNSITEDIGQEWPQISLETVIARRPDALLLVREGKMSIADLASRPGWNTLPAVRERRVYYVDDRIDFPSPVAIDALEDLAKQLHP